MVEQVRPSGLDGARIGVAQQGFQLGEDPLDWVEIGRIARQKEQLGAGRSDRMANGPAFVAPQIVDDDDIAGAERCQELFNISAEADPVNRLVEEVSGWVEPAEGNFVR
jgi:hypothetical protein